MIDVHWGHARSREGLQFRTWTDKMNVEVGRARPSLCDNQLDRMLEIRKSQRGGEGGIVLAGHCDVYRGTLY